MVACELNFEYVLECNLLSFVAPNTCSPHTLHFALICSKFTYTWSNILYIRLMKVIFAYKVYKLLLMSFKILFKFKNFLVSKL